MDNMDDPETTAKISDSAYSNSCSNSQSRRSHSSKSTHSGSHSSGSSGYGGKTSTSGSSNTMGQPPKKDKESKKKKLSQTEVKAAEVVPVDEPMRPPEPGPILVTHKEETVNDVELAMAISLPEQAVENMDTSAIEPVNSKEEAQGALQSVTHAEGYVTSRPLPNSSDGFSCVISMHDGVVMYTSASLTTSLGFPKDIWIGRSFIDFVHPKDHKTFASLITNGLALPKLENGKIDQGNGLTSGSSMVCRIRRYRSLSTAFGVKDVVVTYMPFLLKFVFKDYSEDDVKVIYLVIQAMPFFSAFKTPNELIPKPVPFIIRHGADGILQYLDPESVPYLGYLPQDIQDKNVLDLYHPEDLPYLVEVYESIVKEGNVSSNRPYRLMAQNTDFVRLETEWSSVINPWSMKLECVIAKHHIIEGPTNPDVFQSPVPVKTPMITESETYKIQTFKENIVRVMNEVRTKPAEVAKLQMGRRCQELATFMETLLEETPKQEEELRLEIQDRDLSYYERDSVMLGGISPHHDSDSKSSVETPLSYNQLNYNENLQRYFDSQHTQIYVNFPSAEESNDPGPNVIKPASCNFSPMAQNSIEKSESSSASAVVLYVSSPGPSPVEYQYMKLTESMINKHNTEMEKELVKMHRESRSSKSDREKALNESRKKKKEHLARCNASFQPTAAADIDMERLHRQGLKRPLKSPYNDAHAQKHHCPSPRDQCLRPFPEAGSPPSKPSYTVTTTAATTQWPPTQNMNNYNMYGLSQQMSMLSHVPTASVASAGQVLPKTGTAATGIASMPGTSAMAPMPCASAPLPGPTQTPIPGSSAMDLMPGAPVMAPLPCTSAVPAMPAVPTVPTVPAIPATYGMTALPGQSAMPAVPVLPSMPGTYPVYYGAPGANALATSEQSFPFTSGYQPLQSPLPYMMHGHPISMMYGQPFMYSPMNQQMYMQQNIIGQQNLPFPGTVSSLGLSCNNYTPAYKSPLPIPTRKYAATWKKKKRAEEAKAKKRAAQPCQVPLRGDMSGLRRTTDVVAASSSTNSQNGKMKPRTSEENTDRTDGESSYSSFYSSFFKTDSGSAEDSGDQKNKNNEAKNRFWTKNIQGDDALSFQSSTEAAASDTQKPNKKLARRKMDAPWNEQVNLTSELIYKYQLVTKPVKEVLEEDKKKMESMAQPSLVNEQLGQLYLDLQLQGVAARLTLEEGITSSSSSGEENSSISAKHKRELNKLVIIHEENAPLPAPDTGFLVPEDPIDGTVTPSSMTS